MEIVYREMVKEDIPKMVLLFKELATEKAEVSFAEIASIEEISQWLENEDMFTYIAIKGEKLLGVLRAKRGEGEKSHAVFLTAAVDRSYRGNRIAKEITLYGLERLRQEGIKIARAYVYSNNRSSINTILSCGFTFAGSVYQHHYDEGIQEFVDDLIFHKIL